MSTIEVKVPDIGDFKDVPVIEIMVKPGDAVKAEDALITLESDKATMDVPAPLAGAVQDIKVKVGDKVSEGTVILLLATGMPTGDPVVADAVAKAPEPAETAAIDDAAVKMTTLALAKAARSEPSLRTGGV